MTEKEIINSMMKLTHLSEIDIKIILKKFEIKSIKKKTRILEVGNVSKEIYFILKGCIRVFYVKNGNDISSYFFTESMFAGAYDSFISQKPSRYSLETLEDCTVLSISFKNSQELFKEFPKSNEFVRKILEDRFVSLHHLFTSQIMDTPAERYINLQKNRPDLLNRIPQHQIATFLGITPVSLSRIRNRIVKK